MKRSGVAPSVVGRGLTAAAAGFLLAVVAAVPAHAQSDSSVSKPVTIKLGALFPSDSGTRDFSGSTHFEADVTYEFSKQNSGNPLLFGAFFDYIASSSATQQADYFDDEGSYLGSQSLTGNSSSFGVGLQARYLLVQDRSRRERREGITPYVGAGIGFYDSYAKESGYATLPDGDYYSGSYSDYSHSVDSLGGKLMFGIQSSSGFLGEMSYQWMPSVDGINNSGTGVSIGYRF